MHFAGHVSEHGSLDLKVFEEAGHGVSHFGQRLVHGHLHAEQPGRTALAPDGKVNFVEIRIPGEVDLEAPEESEGRVFGDGFLE